MRVIFFGSKDDHGDVRSFVQRHLGHSRWWNLARLNPQKWAIDFSCAEKSDEICQISAFFTQAF